MGHGLQVTEGEVTSSKRYLPAGQTTHVLSDKDRFDLRSVYPGGQEIRVYSPVSIRSQVPTTVSEGLGHFKLLCMSPTRILVVGKKARAQLLSLLQTHP